MKHMFIKVMRLILIISPHQHFHRLTLCQNTQRISSRQIHRHMFIIRMIITCYTLICVLISSWKVFNLNEIIYITNNSLARSSSLNDFVIFFSVCVYVRFHIQTQKANNIRSASPSPLPISLSRDFTPFVKTIRIRSSSTVQSCIGVMLHVLGLVLS